VQTDTGPLTSGVVMVPRRWVMLRVLGWGRLAKCRVVVDAGNPLGADMRHRTGLSPTGPNVGHGLMS
jgi:hypothetical protein